MNNLNDQNYSKIELKILELIGVIQILNFRKANFLKKKGKWSGKSSKKVSHCFGSGIEEQN